MGNLATIVVGEVLVLADADVAVNPRVGQVLSRPPRKLLVLESLLVVERLVSGKASAS